jgi:hypothetical protein
MDNRWMMILAAAVTAEQTAIVPDKPWAVFVEPADAMFVNLRNGEFERLTIATDEDGVLQLDRSAPAEWDAGAVLVPWDANVETNQAPRVIGNLRREVHKNARI